MFRIATLSVLFALSSVTLAAQFTVRVDAADGNGRVRTAFVYDADGCRGQDVSPAVAWSNPPAGTEGFAVTVYDPDATGGWWHWVVVDIPATTHAMAQGQALPPGAFALANSFGHARWDGPCPPPSDPPHHYVFTVYALDTAALGLGAGATPAEAQAAIGKHALANASVTYTYGR